MNWLEALILGLIQGLTEFLPVSSSGHLELGKHILGVEFSENLTFTVVVHGATVLSTIIVFWKTITELFRDFFAFKWNESTKYIVKIFISMIPVLIIGLLFEEQIESMFSGNILFVGLMLIITALLLAFTYYAKDRQKEISYKDSLVIGIAQAIAVIPGISRSGATIATGLYLGNKKEHIARFSFLMVLIPIIGANLMSLKGTDFSQSSSVSVVPLIIGFIAAFVTGLLACRWMINIVKRGKLIYFAVYCFIIGLIAILFSF
ncbi:MAG: UDP-diphosphatase [Bacteroidetes bacterium GWC2_33_15]|nr:MAG: UDP-diphosphatase [Bacteroidetes bacterium GWA2_33_15]OFX48948.1 MAG: UDP-diphosphatase [Bacteroidetes bacterium GWC2_33_15]OFX64788.1 MAG: UDP-diphosphatase [Bacteroidetes bacterium GWB2_32_14]OFX68490.1 MAG: UDP-diphosphatase [Bacteroidetes bacterium GWD2_33_33]HAN19216.1 UDP-diphosphatase [Bacteroidales bacterium]